MSSTCVILEGGGVGPRPPVPETCAQTATTGDTSESAAVLEGTPCGCASGSSASPALVVLVVLLLRRWGLAGLLAWPVVARAVDAEHLDPDANPRWLAVRDADLGPPWSIHGAAIGSVMRAPAVLRSNLTQQEILSLVSTTTVAAALNIDVVQVQVVAPYHPLILSDTADPARAWGDVGLRFAVPMLDRNSDVRASWTVGIETRSGAPERLLGDAGSGWAALALDVPIVPRVRLGASGALHLRQPVVVPGAVWGRSIELAGGLAWNPRDEWTIAGELFGQLGLESPAASTLPVEGMVRSRVRVGRMGVNAGVGGGMGRGIGNPAWRLVIGVDAQLVSGDRDADRRPDLRDLCPRRPEDLDHHGDLDGCPDPDNDRDGLLDPADACPEAPETVNAWADEDGCPDDRAHLTLRLPADVEQAEILVSGQVTRMFAEEAVTVDLDPGVHEVDARADGFLPFHRALSVPEGPSTLVVHLDPVPSNGIVVRVHDPVGAPVAAVVTVDGAEVSGTRTPHPPGPVVIEARADGFAARLVEAEVPSTGDLTLDLVLAPLEVARVGQEVVLGHEVRFAFDDATVDPRSASLDRLADWLRAHPEVRLLRIEGHADAIGTPAYNYELSLRRAQAVRDALVARGIAPERLLPIGAGEALSDTLAQERAVSFLVLVWDDGWSE